MSKKAHQASLWFVGLSSVAGLVTWFVLVEPLARLWGSLASTEPVTDPSVLVLLLSSLIGMTAVIATALLLFLRLGMSEIFGRAWQDKRVVHRQLRLLREGSPESEGSHGVA